MLVIEVRGENEVRQRKLTATCKETPKVASVHVQKFREKLVCLAGCGPTLHPDIAPLLFEYLAKWPFHQLQGSNLKKVKHQA
jgi:hypothetical protein